VETFIESKQDKGIPETTVSTLQKKHGLKQLSFLLIEVIGCREKEIKQVFQRKNF
jgi:hypothetical protein